jgi:protein-disulfide isomerase
MTIKRGFVTAVLSLAVCAPMFPQSAEEMKALRRDMDAIRDGQKVIQNELEVIKKLLERAPAAAAAPQAFREAAINIDGSPAIGDKDAKVTIVEFSDYQCPFCARNFKQTFPQVMADYIKAGKVKYVFRDFPLESIHPLAFKASEAALCVGEQGKYWEMHDTLFNNQTKLAAADLIEHAKSVGADEAKLKACIDSGKQAAKIRTDLAEGRKLGVSGTPGFFVGLTKPGSNTFTATKNIVGAVPYASFKEAIDTLLGAASEKN